MKGGTHKMENVTQENKIVSQKNNKGMVQMKNTNDIMADAITRFILENDFLVRFITDNVKEKIYDTKEYHESYIESIIENDLNNSYSQGYIADYILDEIDTYELVESIHERFKDDFNEIANQCNNRNY